MFRRLANVVHCSRAGVGPRAEHRPWAATLLVGLTILLLGATIACSPSGAEGRTRTLWMTDLYQPAEDPDDHYDLAVGMGSTKYRPSLVVVDRSREGGRKPARAAVSEAVADSGRRKTARGP